MASSNENNKPIPFKTPPLLSYVPVCLDKLQQKANRGRTPSPPAVKSAHEQQETNYDVLDEMKRIYQLIKDNGDEGDFAKQIKFGDLIPLYGTDQIDKLIEILAITRKNGYINYKLNDFLQQDRDKNICIRLIKKPF